MRPRLRSEQTPPMMRKSKIGPGRASWTASLSCLPPLHVHCPTRTWAVLAVLAVSMGLARAEDLPAPQAILRIEPGMHTAQLTRIGADAACTLMVTGLARQDSAAVGVALLAAGAALSYFALCACPSAKAMRARSMPWRFRLMESGWRRAAGMRTTPWTRPWAVYIFEASTGRLAARLGQFGNVINHLAFSPDGSRLAATLFGGEGMRLWETSGWRLLAEDKDYGGKGSFDAAFDGASRLYTVAFDGLIRRYAADGKLEAKATARGNGMPFSVAVHPKGGKLAIGSSDTAAVDVYDANTLGMAIRCRYRRHSGWRSQQGCLVRRRLAALCGRPVFPGRWPPSGDLARRRPGSAQPGAAVAKHRHAALALRGRHRGRGAGPCLRADRGGWRQARLAGRRLGRYAEQAGRCLGPVRGR